MSNLKQIGMGIMQYTQDYDEKYPMSWLGARETGARPSYTQTVPNTPGAYFLSCHPGSCQDGGTGHWVTWRDMIYPYVKSIQIFTCPSNTGYTRSHGGANKPLSDYHLLSAYGNTASQRLDSPNSSDFASYKYGHPIIRSGVSTAAVVRASETVMAVEGTGSLSAYMLSVSPRTLAYYQHDPSHGPSLVPHMEGMNLIYGDGHVKWQSMKQIRTSIGNGTSTANDNCDLNAIVESRPFCSKMWNPFRS